MGRGRRQIDGLLAAAGVDAADGVQVLAAHRLPGSPVDPGLPLLILAGDGAVDQPLPGRHAHPGARALLGALYPADHLVRRLPVGEPVPLSAVDDAALGAHDWLVPALPLEQNLASPHGMAAISARLRAPDGCPWDRRQDHLSLRPFLLEEAYETVDAIERGAEPMALAEELGDLYLQVVLHAQMAAERGEFDLTDVYRTLGTKIVRRHPHVFGDRQVSGVAEVMTNWETIKAAERADAGRERSSLGDVSRALPALPASREIQERASALGWDWESVSGVWDKVAEELAELRGAGSAAQRLEELGDVLFVMVNLARWLEVDPEEALRAANRRWVARHAAVEALAAERGLDLATLDLAAKDALWGEVKERP